jgi:hypothetical protein
MDPKRIKMKKRRINMKPFTFVTIACILLSTAAYAIPDVSMQDTTTMAQGGDITQVVSNDAQVGGDGAILYQSNYQGAAGTGAVIQSAENVGTSEGLGVYSNQGSIQSAEGNEVLQIAYNGELTLGDSATVGQSITQGATSVVGAEQLGQNFALIEGGDAWLGQLVQSGAIGENTIQEASNDGYVLDISGIGNNAIGQSIILGATSINADQIGDNYALLDGGDGNVAQLAQAGANGVTIDQYLLNIASVINADTFVVGQTNIAGIETDMSAGTIGEQSQYNVINWDANADGLLSQHTEAANFANLIIQDQQNIVNII